MVTDATDVAARLSELLDGREPRVVPDGRVDRRAAVVLLLRPGESAPSGASPSGRGLRSLEALFVLRAERDGDPWSGHVGLPGGHREPGDADLRAAALREVEEETGLVLTPADVVGRLDEFHPRSRRLPSVAVTPFVAWLPDPGPVGGGPEVAGHFWMRVGELESPERRGVLSFRRGEVYRAFPTAEFAGHTIWGLTFVIVRRFLSLLPDGPPAGGDATGTGWRSPSRPSRRPAADDDAQEGA